MNVEIVEDLYSAEEQIHAHCNAKKLSCECDGKTLSTDWEALEDTNMSCKESSGSGEPKINPGRMSKKLDSEPECLDDDGIPGSGSNSSSNTKLSFKFFNHLM